MEINTGKEIIKLTSSFGISSILTSEDSYNLAIKRADMALYKAKESGRNQVVVY